MAGAYGQFANTATMGWQPQHWEGGQGCGQGKAWDGDWEGKGGAWAGTAMPMHLSFSSQSCKSGSLLKNT